MASSVFADLRGRMIRQLREEAGLTQAELAEKAGYGAGGRVALAKIEKGLAEPTTARLAGICAVLGTTPEHLDKSVASVLVADPGPRTGGRLDNMMLGGLGGAEAASNVRRQQAIDVETEGMQRLLSARRAQAATASAGAHVAFVVPFMELATRVDGLPTATAPKRRAGSAPGAPAQVRASIQEMAQVHMCIQILRGAQDVGVAGKKAAWFAMGAYRKASTGTKISELHGAAKSRAITAQFGGGAKAAGGLGIAGGKYVLGAIAVAPMVLAAGGMLAVTVAQSRVRAKTEAARLLEVEDALEADRVALPQILAWADAQAELLTALAGAGGELMPKIEAHVSSERPVEWASLDQSVQRTLHRALELVEALLAVDALPVCEPPTVTDEESVGVEDVSVWIEAVLQHGRDLVQEVPGSA